MLGVLTAGLLLPPSLQAGPFGWFGKKDSGETPGAASTNTVKRLHLALTDKTAEKELLQLTEVKRILFQEKQVLLLLVDEKKRDLANLDAEFTRSFGIRKDRNYHYDAKTLTIYEDLQGAAATTNTPGAAPESRLVKTLTSEQDSRKFASLAAVKQLTQEDLTVLARLAREKEAALARIENVFKNKFSMSRDRNYWYDPKTMQLFELVNSSPKGAVQ